MNNCMYTTNPPEIDEPLNPEDEYLKEQENRIQWFIIEEEELQQHYKEAQL